MTRLAGGSRASPRVHLDGTDDGFPLDEPTNARVEHDNSKSLDGDHLRRLSFGGGGNGAGVGGKVLLPGLDRTNGGRTAGQLAPFPVEKPTFRHVDPRAQRPRVCETTAQ